MWKRVCLHDTKIVDTDSAAIDVILLGLAMLCLIGQLTAQGMSSQENSKCPEYPGSF